MLKNLFRRRRKTSVEDVILAARTIAACLQTGQKDQEAALRAAGFDSRQAIRFANFLPMAFARPVLEQLGVTQFSPTISVDLVDGRSVQVPLDRQPEYIGGLKVARVHRRVGCMPHDVYVAVAGSSADVDAVSQALNVGADIKGAAMASGLAGIYQAEDFIW